MPYKRFRPSTKFLQYFKYQVERFLIRGPFYQVLFIGFIIGLISVVAGEVLLFIEETEGGLSSSAWWAFLRMSDPGYLGDDTGTAKRVLATILTLLGYVLFMGSLVAIMTQWLYRKMKELEAGYTPIMIKGHVAILSYTNRTPIIIQQILVSKRRFKRFLRSNKRASERIVILNDEVGHELTTDLESHIGSGSDLQKVIFRTGDLMSADDLGRINVEHSSVVIIPSMIYGEKGQDSSDTRAVKALLSIKNRADIANVPTPKIVVEILDDNNVEIARSAYDKNVEVVSGRLLLSRMIAQNIQNPGLSYVIAELISQGEGSEIYLKAFPELIGKSWSQIKRAFPACLAIGLVSSQNRERCIINPRSSELILQGDLIIFISSDFEAIDLSQKHIKPPMDRGDALLLKKLVKQKRKLLIMGWSKKAPFLLEELLETQKYDFEIDIVSTVEISQREKILSNMLSADKRTKIKNFQADYNSYSQMSVIDFTQYNNVVFLSSDRASDGSDADARSILGILQLRQIMGVNKNFPVVIELAEPENENLFENREGETIISPMVISYILANVALRFELNRVFNSLFNSGGSDITFISAKQFRLSGDMRFKEVMDEVDSFKMLAIGLMGTHSTDVFLNPKPETVFNEVENYKIIVIN